VPPWAETIVASPLATSTILALGLNLVLNVGVSSRASTQTRLDAGLNDGIARFLERQGASWGARGDVIGRATPAVTERCEELREITGAPSATVDLHFDDFRLLATIRLSSENKLQGSSQGDVFEAALQQIAATIARRYDCSARLLRERGVVLGFEH